MTNKYHFVIDTEDSLIYELDTDHEPPRVGEWLDLGEFGIIGYFLIKRVVHLLGPSPAFVFLRVEKNNEQFNQG